MKKLLSILVLLVSVTQCFKAFSNDQNINDKVEIPIQNHFVFLSVHLKLNKKTQVECLKEKNCVSITDMRQHVRKINGSFINTPLIVGSGFIFNHEKSKTKILTSNHVCAGIRSYLSFQNLLMNSKDGILDAIGENKSYSFLDITQLKSNYNVKTVVSLFDFNGNKYEGISVEKQNKSKDLCVINTNNIIGAPVILSKGNCSYGEEVINVSASDGNYFPNAVPYHIGAYSGTLKNKRFSLFGKNEEVGLYTLDIDQGSSGSAVFSKKTKKLCGNINATMKKSNLSIGSTNNAILEFIRQP